MAKMGHLLKRATRISPGAKGFTLAELVVAIGLSALFTGLILAALASSRQVCTSVTADQDLQQTANVIMDKIIKGSAESGITYRLSEATTYSIVAIDELDFKDIGDSSWRAYFLTQSSTGTELWYRRPIAGVAGAVLIYKAPIGTTLTLRFWPLGGPAYTNITVGIDVGLSKTVNGRTVTGSATTMINIRNHAT